MNRNEFSSPSRTFELQKYHSLYKWGFSCDFYHEKTIASEISEIFLILYLDNQSMHLLWCDFFFITQGKQDRNRKTAHVSIFKT